MLVSVGCREDSAPPRAKPDAKRFVFLTTLGSAVAAADVEAGARGALEGELKAATQIEVLRAVDAAAQAEQLNRIAAARDVDGLAVDAVAAPEVSAAVARCAEAGIPVVTFNSDCLPAAPLDRAEDGRKPPAAGRRSFIGVPLRQVGNLIAGRLLERLGDLRGVVAVVSAPEHPNLTVIERGIKDYLAGVPDLTLRDPVRPAPDPNAVAAAIRGIVREESGVRGWIILNPWAVPDAAATPLERLADAEIIMLGVSDVALDAVGPDVVDVLVSLPFAEYGSAAVQMLSGIVREGHRYPDVCPIGPTVVTLNNVEAVKERRRKFRSGESRAAVVPTNGFRPSRP
jgi:ABC-type sugar transport system substrate-binding protein